MAKWPVYHHCTCCGADAIVEVESDVEIDFGPEFDICDECDVAIEKVEDLQRWAQESLTDCPACGCMHSDGATFCGNCKANLTEEELAHAWREYCKPMPYANPSGEMDEPPF